MFLHILFFYFLCAAIKSTKLDVCMLRGIRRNFMPIKLI
nr:MAG TPA: hypothetical protein [Caudoviricetes sp.]